MSEPRPTIGKIMRKYLVTGILVWLPIVVTIRIIAYIISASDGLTNLLPAQWQPATYLGFNLPGLGF